MKKTSIIPAVAAILIAASTSVFPQGGPLTPPSGAPAPEMRSLQEIWDKLEGIELQLYSIPYQTSSLVADEIASQQQRIEALQRTQNLSLYLTGQLAWNQETVDPSGGGVYNSLAFGPDGQPAIAYHSPSGTGTLRLARYTGALWSESTVGMGGSYTGQVSLAFGADSLPGIAFQSGAALKFARMGVFIPAP